jgi:hypothetical protein
VEEERESMNTTQALKAARETEGQATGHALGTWWRCWVKPLPQCPLEVLIYLYYLSETSRIPENSPSLVYLRKVMFAESG